MTRLTLVGPPEATRTTPDHQRSLTLVPVCMLGVALSVRRIIGQPVEKLPVLSWRAPAGRQINLSTAGFQSARQLGPAKRLFQQAEELSGVR